MTTDVERFLDACGTAEAARAKGGHPKASVLVDAATAARVREARAKSGLTQLAVGKLAGMSQNSFREVERGGRVLPDTLARVLAALGLGAKA